VAAHPQQLRLVLPTLARAMAAREAQAADLHTVWKLGQPVIVDDQLLDARRHTLRRGSGGGSSLRGGGLLGGGLLGGERANRRQLRWIGQRSEFDCLQAIAALL